MLQNIQSTMLELARSTKVIVDQGPIKMNELEGNKVARDVTEKELRAVAG